MWVYLYQQADIIILSRFGKLSRAALPVALSFLAGKGVLVQAVNVLEAGGRQTGQFLFAYLDSLCRQHVHHLLQVYRVPECNL